MTFKDLYDIWLKQPRLNVTPSTIVTNRRFVEGHVLPHLGDMKLDGIAVFCCQKLVNEEYNPYPYFRKVTAQIMRYGETMEIMKDNRMLNKFFHVKKKKKRNYSITLKNNYNTSLHAWNNSETTNN